MVTRGDQLNEEGKCVCGGLVAPGPYIENLAVQKCLQFNDFMVESQTSQKTLYLQGFSINIVDGIDKHRCIHVHALKRSASCNRQPADIGLIPTTVSIVSKNAIAKGK